MSQAKLVLCPIAQWVMLTNGDLSETPVCIEIFSEALYTGGWSSGEPGSTKQSHINWNFCDPPSPTVHCVTTSPLQHRLPLMQRGIWIYNFDLNSCNETKSLYSWWNFFISRGLVLDTCMKYSYDIRYWIILYWTFSASSTASCQIQGFNFVFSSHRENCKMKCKIKRNTRPNSSGKWQENKNMKNDPASKLSWRGTLYFSLSSLQFSPDKW